MNKPLKLSKQTLILFAIFTIVISVAIFMKCFEKKVAPEVTKEPQLVGLVAEDQVLKVELLDMVSAKNAKNKEQLMTLTVAKGENVLGYKMAKKQTYNKIMKLLPPDNSILLNHSSEAPTHQSYVIELKGDIVKYVDEKGKELYYIVNARLNYYRQSLLLESDYNSVYIASIDGKKEKMVKIEEYKRALSDPNQYMTMLQW